LVRAVRHERYVFAASDQSCGKTEWRHKYFVARCFIVKAEAITIGADFYKSAGKGLRLLGSDCLFNCGNNNSLIARMQRITPEAMFDVGHQQFLMLLLVIASQFSQR
jgi:hypothetical protein